MSLATGGSFEADPLTVLLYGMLKAALESQPTHRICQLMPAFMQGWSACCCNLGGQEQPGASRACVLPCWSNHPKLTQLTVASSPAHRTLTDRQDGPIDQL